MLWIVSLCLFTSEYTQDLFTSNPISYNLKSHQELGKFVTAVNQILLLNTVLVLIFCFQ